MTRCITVTAVFAVHLFWAGCTDISDAEAPPVACEVDGVAYEDGETFAAGDGCNSCTCNPDGDTPGQVECSAIDCSPGTECTTAPPDQECPTDCGTTCSGSCADVCGLMCAMCVEVAEDEFDWVVYAIDCNCTP